jgi:hypothetical protein
MASQQTSPFPTSETATGVRTVGEAPLPSAPPTSQPAATSSTDANSVRANGAAGDSDRLTRVVQGAHQAVDRMADTAAPHVQRLQEGVSTAGARLTARADDLRDTGDEWAESLRMTVRENPLTALVAALAIGVVISRLTS